MFIRLATRVSILLLAFDNISMQVYDMHYKSYDSNDTKTVKIRLFLKNVSNLALFVIFLLFSLDKI